jgi:DNA-binding NarL/FixJ family response regulator
MQREGIDVMIVCRSELLLLGLERLLVQAPDMTVATYVRVPAPPAETDFPGEEREPRRVGRARGRRLRVAIISDRQSKDVVGDCEVLLESFADEVVLLLSRPDVGHVLGCMGAGVRSFVMEGERPEVLVSAIRAAARRDTYMGHHTLDFVVEWLAEEHSGGRRSRRGKDMDLLGLLAEGRSTAEIAERLHLAPKTVRNRVSMLYRKLGVHSRGAAVRLAEERGLLDPADPGRNRRAEDKTK